MMVRAATAAIVAIATADARCLHLPVAVAVHLPQIATTGVGIATTVTTTAPGLSTHPATQAVRMSATTAVAPARPPVPSSSIGGVPPAPIG